MISTKKLFVLLFLLGVFFILSCGGSGRTVKRLAVDQQMDISGRWNDSDASMVAKAMIKQVLSGGWLENFKEENDRKPVIIVGRIRNKTSEHLNTGIFIKDIEKEMVNSGRVKFVASQKQRKEIRDERMDQQSYSSMESAKELANETGADFMLQGEISSVIDSFEGRKVILYKVDLELIDIENTSKVWMGDKKIKKYIKQKKYDW